MKKTLFLLLLTVSTLLVSCFEDNDDSIQPASAVEIQEFIWRGLNFFYLYKADTPELADDAFATNDEFITFLSTFASPESFFDFLKSPQDRFSLLVSDFTELENALAGITINNGMEFGLIFYPDNSGNVFGYVRYILPNSDAESKGLQRGIIFNTIDGQQINEDNFSGLLSPDTYTIGLATFDGQNITPTGESVELTKSEFTEDPIHVSTTLDINGQKIGYMMYNAFTNEFDTQLNSVFAQFQSDGVTELVLDLRYNGGGSVRTAIYLASMITGQFTGQTFFTEQWNEDRQAEFAEDGVFVSSFVNGGEAINSLNLTTVYVLTTSKTASASELVINGLTPYINVVQIGDNTTGKYQASFLMYDSPNFQKSTELNPNHTYAMLPLVFQTANADGFTDFEDGLIPDIDQIEDYSNLGILGDPAEPLLATAIQEITGVPVPGTRIPFISLETLSESKANSLTYQVMVSEK
ncbi:MAG: S41 family peptidase [Bacteroidetes bacterium]|nr:S41 family peptidase [Bacteroidota bacterium]